MEVGSLLKTSFGVLMSKNWGKGDNSGIITALLQKTKTSTKNTNETGDTCLYINGCNHDYNNNNF